MSHIEPSELRPHTARRRQRVLAILAGGLVLGVGAAITLAAWNDSEYATGTFSAGTFNIQGTSDNTTWDEHASAGGAASLSFTLNPTSLSPGDVVYAPFAVRVDQTTTSGANVAITVDSSSGTILSGLNYQLIQPTSWGCASGTTGTTLVPAGTAMTGIGGGPAAFALAAGTPPTTAGAPAYLCFKVTAAAGLTQSSTGTVTWKFAATSAP